MQELYHQYRNYLFKVAYNMLGQVQEAEDLVQDAFEEMLEKDLSPVKNLKAYLARVVANKAIDRLEALKKDRELYPGPWLPEPLVTTGHTLEDAAPQEGVLQYEVMHALEQLNPTERAAFVLRTAFSFPYEALAEICQTSEANCRQLLRRAKHKVAAQAKVGVPTATPALPIQKMMELFLQSCLEGNPQQLALYLQKDVALFSDGGGKATAALNVLHGSDVVSKFLIGVTQKRLQQLSYQPVQINNSPAVLILADGLPDSLLYVQTKEGLLSRIFIVRNPDKIILQ